MSLCDVLRSQNEIEENSTVKIKKNNVFFYQVSPK
jgi:hypothetical protein